MFLFKKITIENFKSISKATLNLDNQGLVLIEGRNETNNTFQSNGSGKSSLLEAITYALYDTTPSGVTADKVVNKNAGKNTKVELSIEIDNLPYTITRYRKHSKFKNTVKLYQGELNLTGKSVKDTNEKILKLFGIDYATYLNSIMYGQGNTVLFSQATDKGKKDILENITNTAIYKHAQTIAKQELNSCSLERDSIQLKLSAKFSELDRLTNSQEEFKRIATKQKEDLAKNKAELKKLEGQLAIRTSEHELTIEKLNRDLTMLLEFKDKNFNQVLQIPELPNTDELNSELSEATDKLNKLHTARSMVERDITNTKTELGYLDSSDTCRLCGAPIDNTHVLQESKRLKDNLAHLEKNHDVLESGSITVQVHIDKLKTKLKNINDSYTKLYEDYKEKTKDVQQLESEIQQARMKLTVSETNSIVESLKTQIDFIKNTIANFELIEITDYSKDIDELTNDIEALNRTKQALEASIQDYSDIVNKVFSNSGIRSVVLDLTTPFLTERANHYLESLADSDISIEFVTQKEKADGSLSDKFDIIVDNTHGGEEYQSNSAGERKRIDLSIALAIQDLVMSQSNLQTNLVLYDECFDGLDAIGCENVISILKEKQKTIGSIFVITHNENLKPLFDKSIVIEKVDGNSTLVDGINHGR